MNTVDSKMESEIDSTIESKIDSTIESTIETMIENEIETKIEYAKLTAIMYVDHGPDDPSFVQERGEDKVYEDHHQQQQHENMENGRNSDDELCHFLHELPFNVNFVIRDEHQIYIDEIVSADYPLISWRNDLPSNAYYIVRFTCFHQKWIFSLTVDDLLRKSS